MIVQRLLRLTKDVFVYGFGSALTGVVGIVLIPVLTHLLPPSEYGMLDLLITVVFLANVVLTFGFDTASAILFFERDDELSRSRIMNSMVSFTVLFTALIAALLFPFRESIASVLLHDSGRSAAVGLTLAIMPLSVFLGLLLAGLRYRFAKRQYILIQAVYFTLTIALSLVFLTVFSLGLVGYLLAWLLSALLATSMAVLFYKQFRFSFHSETLRELFRLGLPVVPAGLAGWSLSLIDRFFVNTISPETLGLYSLGVKIASIIGLGVAALQLAWGPFALSIAREGGAKETYAKTLTLVSAIGVGVALILAAFSSELVAIISAPAFHEAGRVVGLLALGLVAYGSYYIVSIGVNIAHRTGLISWTTAFAAVTHIGLNFVFIPRFGMYGAAIASVVAYALSSLLLAYVGGKLYPIAYEWRKVARVWSIGIVGVVSFMFFPLSFSIPFFVLKITLLVLFLGMMIVLRVIHTSEIRAAVGLAQASFNRFRQ